MASVLTTPLPDPPFYKASRISNGPVAVETMTKILGFNAAPSLHLVGPATGANYSVAGARAGLTDTASLSTQVAFFLQNHSNTASADALYVVFIGANDVRDARNLLTNPDRIATIDAAIVNIEKNIELLVQAGARNFLVVNSPDIGLAPETLIIASQMGDNTYIELATDLSKLFNKKLKKLVARLRDHDFLKINTFNYFRFTSKLIKHATKFGFTINDEPCFDTKNMQFLPGCNNGENFDQYVFFDALHLTARVHKAIGVALALDIGKFNLKEHKYREMASTR